MRVQQLALVCTAGATTPCRLMASNAQQAHQLDKRGEKPAMQWDLNTIGTCSYWYDNYEGLTCKEVRDWKFAISPADFSRWNPSITLDCGNWQALSYCVEVKSEQTSSRTSSTSLTSPRTSSTAPMATRKPELLGWEPLGCYVDDGTLHNHTTKAGGDRLTVSECETACFADNFEYAGVKAGRDCWCGTYVGNSWTENQNDCSIPCPGDAAQICGGVSVFNIFEAKTKGTLPPLSTTTAAASSSNSSSGSSSTAKLTVIGLDGSGDEKSAGRGYKGLRCRSLAWRGGVLLLVLHYWIHLS